MPRPSVFASLAHSGAGGAATVTRQGIARTERNRDCSPLRKRDRINGSATGAQSAAEPLQGCLNLAFCTTGSGVKIAANPFSCMRAIAVAR